MLDTSKVGKVIFISGPPFSGKTYLISLITNHFENFKVVNYELYYRSGYGYKEFYKHIKDLSDVGYNVIGESVNNYVNKNKDHKWCPYKFKTHLNILISIFSKQHRRNFNKFADTFGWKQARERASYKELSDLRKSNITPDEFIIYDGKNSNEILKVIKDYVDN